MTDTAEAGAAPLAKPKRRSRSRSVRSDDGTTITPMIDRLGRRNYGKLGGAGKPGRPVVQLDEQQIERLAAHGISIADIAACLGVSDDTVSARYKDAIARGRARGHANLRARMYSIAEQDRDLKAAKDVLIHLDLREFGALDRGEQQPQLHEHLHVMLDRPAEEIRRALAAAEMREARALPGSTNGEATTEVVSLATAASPGREKI